MATAERMAYKNLLQWLDDSIRKKELQQMKFLIDIPAGKSDKITCPLELFHYMEGKEMMDCKNMDQFKVLLKNVGRHDLATEVQKYIAKTNNVIQYYQRDEEPRRQNPTVTGIQNAESFRKPSGPTEDNEDEKPPDYKSLYSKRPSESIDETNDKSDDNTGSSKLTKYKMSSDPRGICLIISNSNFEEARKEGSKLNDRVGSKMDVSNLKKTFKKLKFDVQIRENLTEEGIWTILSGYSDDQRKDFLSHTKYDCFVCCILTHGSDGGLFGVDGVSLNIQHILGRFETTQSLKGKPKLFFFQACRGNLSTQLYKKDSPGCQPTIIEQKSLQGSDFFIGYATPPEHTAWLGKNGSLYISALCESINGSSENEDIHDIATKTNSLVSKYGVQTDGKVQIPQPVYTLTKKLYLHKTIDQDEEGG